MRLTLLTADGVEHRYVAHVLASAFPDALQAIVLAQPTRRSLVQSTRVYLRRYNARQLGSRILARLYTRATGHHARRDATFARYFGAQASTGVSRTDLVRVVPSHNGAACEALLKELRPEIIAVYGTALIRPNIIRLASRAVLNMHTGISPRYRGSDTVFWPIHNREPEWIGVTVHVLDEGVDSGPILRTGRPTITADDDEHSLFAKCVIEGARLYVDAIQHVAAGPVNGLRQDLASGRQYKFVDRTISAEYRVRRMLRRGVLADFARHSK